MLNKELYNKAQELMENRKFGAALNLLEKLYIQHPGDPFIKFDIATLKARKFNTMEEAKEMFMELLEVPKKSSEALLEIGKIENRLGNGEKARSCFRKLISREQYPNAYIELATLEFINKNYDKAREILKELIDKNDTHVSAAWYRLGKIERVVGNFDAARKCFENFTERDKDREVYSNWKKLELAKIELAEGNKEKAIEMLTELLETNIVGTVLLELVKIHIRFEEYDIAYEYNNRLLKFSSLKIDFNPKQANVFLQYKLGLSISSDNPQESFYFTKQLLNYNEEDTIEHIKIHSDDDSEKLLHSVYSEAIDIVELYKFACNKIKDMEPTEYTFPDKYNIICDKVIGITPDNKPTDTLGVITIPNTKNILTMYPVPAINNKLSVNEIKEKVKEIKRESAIDKFYRRYGKK